MPTRPYHHGSLRPALLAAALAAIGDAGPTALSMRDVARRAGVSHAASAHHFGDKAGLLTALAAQGYQLLAGELEAAQAAPASSSRWAWPTCGSRRPTRRTSR